MVGFDLPLSGRDQPTTHPNGITTSCFTADNVFSTAARNSIQESNGKQLRRKTAYGCAYGAGERSIAAETLNTASPRLYQFNPESLGAPKRMRCPSLSESFLQSEYASIWRTNLVALFPILPLVAYNRTSPTNVSPPVVCLLTRYIGHELRQEA
jgi:hypothetical protein